RRASGARAAAGRLPGRSLPDAGPLPAPVAARAAAAGVGRGGPARGADMAMSQLPLLGGAAPGRLAAGAEGAADPCTAAGGRARGAGTTGRAEREPDRPALR